MPNAQTMRKIQSQRLLPFGLRSENHHILPHLPGIEPTSVFISKIGT
jgi:hypothetical protein